MKFALTHRLIPLMLGGILGVATILVSTSQVGASAASQTPASHPGSCLNFHANVDGYDASEPRSYGDEGDIYVNTESALSTLQDSIFRSLFVIAASGDDVEIGWTDGGGIGTPTVYSEWINDGVDSDRQPYRGYSLSTNSTYHFRVENVGNQDIWRFIVDGQSGPFNYSPTMNFNYGFNLNNSERYNNCDPLYTSFTELGYSNSPTNWVGSYLDLECAGDTSSDYYFNKLSDNENNVTLTPGVKCY
jgi:hypothetical protein